MPQQESWEKSLPTPSSAINTELRAASKSLDVAVQKGVLHKNAAANKKSSMAKAAAKAGAR